MPNLRHSFVSTKSDSADASLVRPTNWNAQLQYTDSSGAPSGTAAFIREALTSNRTYYVRKDGSNSNNGLTNTAGGAFLTIQYAHDFITGNLDCNGFVPTIQVGPGTWTEQVSLYAVLGGFCGSIVGDNTTPSNCLMSITGNDLNSAAFTTQGPGATWEISGFKYTSITAGGALRTFSLGSAIYLSGNNEFGTLVHQAMQTNSGTAIYTFTIGAGPLSTSDITISGSASIHVSVSFGGVIWYFPSSVTLTGTPAFSTAFATCGSVGYLQAFVTFTGSATGPRYLVESGGVMQTFGSGANFWPGDVAGSGGTTAGGGYYL